MMDLVFWKVKGHTGIQITKENLHNKKYSFDEIKDADHNIVKEVEENLENGGIIFGLTNKKIIKALYLFKLTTKGKQKVLVFDKKVVLETANKGVKEFEKDIHTVLNSILFDRIDIDKAIWQDKEITKKEKFKAIIESAKTFAWIGIIFCCIWSLVITACSTSYSFFSVSNVPIEKIKNDESLMDYISYINNYSYSDTINAMSEINNKFGLVTLKIIIPTAFILFGYILLIITLKEVLDFLKDVTDDKTLYTNEKYKMLQKILLQVYIALLFLLGNILLWLAIGIIIEIIKITFNYCVQLNNDKNNLLKNY